MTLEEELDLCGEENTPEVICRKYDDLRNKKMEMLYSGKQEAILLSCIMLYHSLTGR